MRILRLLFFALFVCCILSQAQDAKLKEEIDKRVSLLDMRKLEGLRFPYHLPEEIAKEIEANKKQIWKTLVVSDEDIRSYFKTLRNPDHRSLYLLIRKDNIIIPSTILDLPDSAFAFYLLFAKYYSYLHPDLQGTNLGIGISGFLAANMLYPTVLADVPEFWDQIAVAELLLQKDPQLIRVCLVTPKSPSVSRSMLQSQVLRTIEDLQKPFDPSANFTLNISSLFQYYARQAGPLLTNKMPQDADDIKASSEVEPSSNIFSAAQFLPYAQSLSLKDEQKKSLMQFDATIVAKLKLPISALVMKRHILRRLLFLDSPEGLISIGTQLALNADAVPIAERSQAWPTKPEYKSLLDSYYAAYARWIAELEQRRTLVADNASFQIQGNKATVTLAGSPQSWTVPKEALAKITFDPSGFAMLWITWFEHSPYVAQYVLESQKAVADARAARTTPEIPDTDIAGQTHALAYAQENFASIYTLQEKKKHFYDPVLGMLCKYFGQPKLFYEADPADTSIIRIILEWQNITRYTPPPQSTSQSPSGQAIPPEQARADNYENLRLSFYAQGQGGGGGGGGGIQVGVSQLSWVRIRKPGEKPQVCLLKDVKEGDYIASFEESPDNPGRLCEEMAWAKIAQIKRMRSKTAIKLAVAPNLYVMGGGLQKVFSHTQSAGIGAFQPVAMRSILANSSSQHLYIERLNPWAQPAGAKKVSEATKVFRNMGIALPDQAAPSANEFELMSLVLEGYDNFTANGIVVEALKIPWAQGFDKETLMAVPEASGSEAKLATLQSNSPILGYDPGLGKISATTEIAAKAPPEEGVLVLLHFKTSDHIENKLLVGPNQRIVRYQDQKYTVPKARHLHDGDSLVMDFGDAQQGPVVAKLIFKGSEANHSTEAIVLWNYIFVKANGILCQVPAKTEQGSGVHDQANTYVAAATSGQPKATPAIRKPPEPPDPVITNPGQASKSPMLPGSGTPPDSEIMPPESVQNLSEFAWIKPSAEQVRQALPIPLLHVSRENRLLSCDDAKSNQFTFRYLYGKSTDPLRRWISLCTDNEIELWCGDMQGIFVQSPDDQTPMVVRAKEIQPGMKVYYLKLGNSKLDIVQIKTADVLRSTQSQRPNFVQLEFLQQGAIEQQTQIQSEYISAFANGIMIAFPTKGRIKSEGLDMGTDGEGEGNEGEGQGDKGKGKGKEGEGTSISRSISKSQGFRVVPEAKAPSITPSDQKSAIPSMTMNPPQEISKIHFDASDIQAFGQSLAKLEQLMIQALPKVSARYHQYWNQFLRLFFENPRPEIMAQFHEGDKLELKRAYRTYVETRQKLIQEGSPELLTLTLGNGLFLSVLLYEGGAKDAAHQVVEDMLALIMRIALTQTGKAWYANTQLYLPEMVLLCRELFYYWDCQPSDPVATMLELRKIRASCELWKDRLQTFLPGVPFDGQSQVNLTNVWIALNQKAEIRDAYSAQGILHPTFDARQLFQDVAIPSGHAQAGHTLSDLLHLRKK